MRIRSLTDKSGIKIILTDFTILVGSNNVGKSQTLKDIRSILSYTDPETVVVHELEIEKPESFDFLTSKVCLKQSDSAGRR
ncbi:MAG: hypothetical protein MUP02_09800 [Actinobacteria bacterium]|nr:hypothetical protein [Actinomycetota bacterium]